MKGFIKIVSFVLLMVAVGGGVYLVQKNQETRRGATANETSSTILPSQNTTNLQENFSVHVWVNTGTATDKLNGANFAVKYDPTLLQFVGSTDVVTGYILESSTGPETGMKSFILTMSAGSTEYKSGAIDLVKLTFKPLLSSLGYIEVVPGGTLSIVGQSTPWVIATNNKGCWGDVGLGGCKGDDPMPTVIPTVIPNPVNSSVVLPAIVNVASIGKTFAVTVRISNNVDNKVNGTNKLSKANLIIGYDYGNIQFVKAVPLLGYTISNTTRESTKGNIVLNMVSGGSKSVFPATIVRLYFKAAKNGVANIQVAATSKIGINAAALVPLASNTRSRVSIGTVVSTPIPTPKPCISFVDDFSGTSLNTSNWSAYTSGAGMSGYVANSAFNFSLIGSTKSESSSINAIRSVKGDFSIETTFMSHETTGGKLNSNLYLMFRNSDWSKFTNITMPISKLPGELVAGWVETTGQKSVGISNGIGGTVPVMVKITRIGSNFSFYYKKFGSNAYTLIKQLDNYYSDEGLIGIGLDNWAPDFPASTGAVNDFRLYCGGEIPAKLGEACNHSTGNGPICDTGLQCQMTGTNGVCIQGPIVPTVAPRPVNSSRVLPANIPVSIGKTFAVTVQVDNAGVAVEQLSKANLILNYNYGNIQFVKAVPQSGYKVTNATIESTKGTLTINMISGTKKLGFPANLVKVYFKAVKNGPSSIVVVNTSKIGIDAHPLSALVTNGRSLVAVGSVIVPTIKPTLVPTIKKVNKSSILPATVNVISVGKTFAVTVQVNNTGIAGQKLSSADLIINYSNIANISFVKAVPLSKYKLTTQVPEATRGTIILNLTSISTTTKLSFPANLVRLYFKGIANGTSNIQVHSSSKIGINSLAKSLLVTNNKSVVNVGTAVPPKGDLNLNYKVSFGNVNANNAKCVVDWPFKIMVMGAGKTKVFTDILPDSKSAVDTKLVFTGKLNLADFDVATGVAAFFSGPKHLQVKYGQNNQSTVYNQAVGNLVLTDVGGTVYDFSNYPMIAGDVVSNNGTEEPDGIINAVDYAYIKSKVIIFDKVEEGNYLQADLNGDCAVNSGDISIFKTALQDKQGQLY